jgi:hypothetical protein
MRSGGRTGRTSSPPATDRVRASIGLALAHNEAALGQEVVFVEPAIRQASVILGDARR